MKMLSIPRKQVAQQQISGHCLCNTKAIAQHGGGKFEMSSIVVRLVHQVRTAAVGFINGWIAASIDHSHGPGAAVTTLPLKDDRVVDQKSGVDFADQTAPPKSGNSTG